MSAKILDGKILAAQLKEKLAREISNLKKSTNKLPRLYAISFLKDPSIDNYRLSQSKAADFLGIEYIASNLCVNNTEEALISLKALLSEAPHAAIFIFTPLPTNIDFNLINERLGNVRNVEGLYPMNLGFFFLGSAHCLYPPTPAAAVELLKSSQVTLSGKTAVVLGRSNVVGKPLIHLLLTENLTVTVCHSKTQMDKMVQLVQSADIVFACVGKPAFVKKEWVKPGAIVIDIGTNEVNGKIVGDVAEDVRDVAGYISPVPGGVGPVTSVMLIKNVVEVFKKFKESYV